MLKKDGKNLYLPILSHIVRGEFIMGCGKRPNSHFGTITPQSLLHIYMRKLVVPNLFTINN
jgi:hypothetical protein